MIYVVLGMGNSGTSLLARTLHASGIHMGDGVDTISYDEGGYGERRKFRELNRSMLGTHRDRIFPGPEVLMTARWRWSRRSR